MIWRSSNFFLYLFATFGVLLLAASVVTGFNAARFQLSAAHASGTVVGNTYVSRSRDRGGSYHPRVEFVTPDAQRHTFTGSHGSKPAAFHEGESVGVLYDPAVPETACIDTVFQQYSVTLAVFAFGALFAFCGGSPLCLRASRERLDRWLQINGQRIEASIVEIDSARPYTISAQWTNPATGEVHWFQSEGLRFNPAPYVSQTVAVSIDPSNAKRYAVDTSFLPAFTGRRQPKGKVK